MERQKIKPTPAKPNESGHSTGEPIQLFWKTERRKVGDLVPYEQNPRTMSEKQVKDLRKSLERFNLVEIPVVDTRNRIIAGHQRLKILTMLGRGDEEIEVRVPCRDLTDKEFREYNVRSNKNLGSWDFDILANAFDSADLVEWGFEAFELGGVEIPGGGKDGMVPQKDPNIICRVSFHPALWIGKRDEILNIFEQMKKAYSCEVKVEE